MRDGERSALLIGTAVFVRFMACLRRCSRGVSKPKVMAEVSSAGNPRVELDGRAITVSMWSRMGAPGLASPPAADVDSASHSRLSVPTNSSGPGARPVGVRAANSSSATCTVNVPATASSVMVSPSCTRANGPPDAASGVRWIAAGTFPEAPDILPSVTSATRWPRSLKVVSTNICGSDQHMVRGRTTAPEGLVLGHEITGEVIEVGRVVEFISIGDLVSVPFNIACGRCVNCKERKTGICLNVNPDRPGSAYGYVDMPASWTGI